MAVPRPTNLSRDHLAEKEILFPFNNDFNNSSQTLLVVPFANSMHSGRSFTRPANSIPMKPSSGESPFNAGDCGGMNLIFSSRQNSNLKETFQMIDMNSRFVGTPMTLHHSGGQDLFFRKEAIRAFDSISTQSQNNHEESGTADQAFLQKRKRGRPKKIQGDRINPRKKQVEQELEVKEDNLIFMNEHAHVFESDSETQQCLLDKEELDKSFALVFSNNNGMSRSSDQEINSQSFKLDIGKLIKAIESEQAKNKIKKFVCRFCGKAFDKPSSLGGHTAKTHNGLSLKYKNRLTAAKNRKTERTRIQFLKASINQGYAADSEPTTSLK